MKRLKIVTLLLAFTLTVSILPITASAASSYCQRLVNGNQCGKILSWYTTGRSITQAASHKYGGILGIGQSTCNYEYYVVYKEHRCISGHIDDTKEDRIESKHTCGK